MSKTVTSNEGSKKKKDLLSQYPNKEVGPNCIIFTPNERQIQSNKGVSIDISWLDDIENVMIVPVVANIKENYDEIPAERGTIPKEKRTSRKTSEKTEKSTKTKTTTTTKIKASTKKSTQRDSEESR